MRWEVFIFMSKNIKTEKPIIEVKDLTKKFNGFTAVDKVSFNIIKGDIFAFLGPNGAGKTTTIRILTTLLRPTEGKIKVNSYDPITQQDKVRKSFGIVFQDSSLDDELTAYENMKLHAVLYKIPKEDIEKRIKGLLEIVDLWGRKDGFVKTFSGGMRRRLEIARSLLHYPKIFFMDEPTLGLDAQTRNSIWEHINNLNKKYKTTIFFTTHYLEEAEKMAKTIAIIDNGKIVAKGTVKQLKKDTNTKSLEEAYLALTGKNIREENATAKDRMSMRMRQRRR
ncbi:ATP-binding cassette domain-containing protein [Candidatus Woesebacteria bacterium]|nr:ATP-binding cassette domain-containing protein [Candidatus Woesebacteria bacterium]